MSKITKRNGYIDYLKGILICMVIWWHCTTVLWMGQANTNHFLLKTITASFGMPLFMGISGYFLAFSCNSAKSTAVLLLDKLKRIALPCLIWESIMCLLSRNLGNYGSLWYLWSYLFNSVLLILIVRLAKGKIIKCVMCIAAGLLIAVLPFDKWYLAWMYPCLCAGYAVNKIGKEDKVIIKWGGVLSFAVMCLFWKWDYTVYMAGSSWSLHYESIPIFMFRLFIALSGSLTMIYITRILYKIAWLKQINRVFELCGKHSFELYILQDIIILRITVKIMSLLGINGYVLDIPKPLIDYVLSVMMMLLVVFGCIVFSAITSRVPILRKVLWGQYSKR